MTDVDQNIEMHVGTFRLLERIGGGGFASVYRAISFIDGAEKLVAVKQSRAPLRLKRPMLQHEARVLQLLQGHPTIPLVYAYGHLTHFEFLSIELLGPTLGDLKHKEGPLGLKRVAQMAVQLISALKHVHDHGIVHRDIKPSNILVSLDTSDQVRLADFGIATPIHSGAHNEHGAVKKNKPFIGTLSWASLNAHEGCDPSPRDDLESIAYTLLDLIRDKLPWERYDKAIIPILRGSAHVKKRKMGWNGARFALGSITEFGELLDYARSLEFNDRPDYDHWCGAFSQIPELGRQMEDDALVEPGTPPTFIVSPGQLVFVQVLAKPTIEGYVNHADDYSYWHDPELCTKDWVTKFRPAIVLEILERNGWNEKYDIRVLPITQGEVTPKDGSKNRVRIIGAPGDEGIVVPDWPLEGTYCYSFPYPEEFVPVPQASDPVPAFWKVSEQDLKMLIERFRWKTPISKSDSSLYRRMENRQTVRIYVDIKPMLPETLHLGFDSVEIDWKGERGWFDELLKIFQKASADNGNPWTGMGPSVVKRAELDDSYFDFDMSEWDNRQDDERSCSLTLSADLEGKLDNGLGQIEVVEKDFGNSRRVYRAKPQLALL